MIGRKKGELVVVCEECGGDEYGGTLDFREFIEDLKSKGWKIKKTAESWEHICPSCNEE